MLNYFNFQRFEDGFLLTNDFGRFAYLAQDDLSQLLDDDASIKPSLRKELIEKGFVFDGSPEGFSLRYENGYRDAKNYVFASTGLHILVMSTACNLACVYCQANAGVKSADLYMKADVAEDAVRIALDSPSNRITIEFQGGEPLTNFETIEHVVRYVEEHKGSKTVEFSLVSNLTLVSDEILEFLVQHKFGLSTSIDGFQALHNLNRPFRAGGGSYSLVMDSLSRVRKAGLNVGVIETTTKESLAHPVEIIDALVATGVNSISIRPLTPLGCAGVRWDEIGYTPEEYTAFYKKALERVIQLCEEGMSVQEGTASVFFAKALHGYPVNHMEYRSPCGGAFGQMAYYPDGGVYTCDEGRMLYQMGDDAFKLGNVRESAFADLVSSSVARSVALASVLESNPACCDCVFQPYCGSCPVVNYALEGDLRSKNSQGYRCGLAKGVFGVLFSTYLNANEEQRAIMESWHV